jgi:aminoglycoside phosphotransferase (APT) family kinase protein
MRMHDGEVDFGGAGVGDPAADVIAAPATRTVAEVLADAQEAG